MVCASENEVVVVNGSVHVAADVESATEVVVSLSSETEVLLVPASSPHSADTPYPVKNSPSKVSLFTFASEHATSTSAPIISRPAIQEREHELVLLKSVLLHPGISSCQTDSQAAENPWIFWNCDREIAAALAISSNIKNSIEDDDGNNDAAFLSRTIVIFLYNMYRVVDQEMSNLGQKISYSKVVI